MMNGKTVLVTGSTDGIGREIALELAAMGAKVLVHGRSLERGRQVVETIRRESSNPNVELYLADFSSLREVRRLAGDILASQAQLDVLVNNAGGFMKERIETVDGLETTFAVNHVAPFLLTNLLLELCLKTSAARIVNVSSMTHAFVTLDFDNLQGEKEYNGRDAYGVSKLGNVLFTYELAERLAHSGVTANCLHPGVIGTKLLRAGFQSMGSHVKEGAKTPVYLSTSEEVAGLSGKYFVDCKDTPSSPLSYDVPVRKQLWDITARLAGL